MSMDVAGEDRAYMTPERVMIRDLARDFVQREVRRPRTGWIRSVATCRSN